MSEKKKKQKNGLSTGAIIAIVIGAVIIVAILAYAFSGGDFEDHDSNSNIDTEQAQVQENEFFNGNNFFEKNNDYEYEQADEKWQQYVSIIESDENKLDTTGEAYCSWNLTKSDLSACSSRMLPLIKNYKTHINSAQDFLGDEGDVFSNTIELRAWLDDKEVMADTFEKEITYLVENTN